MDHTTDSTPTGVPDLLVPSTPALRAVVAVTARVTGCPVAMINVIDVGRQYTVAAHGYEAGGSVPVAQSACAGVIARGAPIVISDVSGDVDKHRDVVDPVRESGFRAYAGIPVGGQDGSPLATLCVLDIHARRARDFDDAGFQQCAVLAAEALAAAWSTRRDRDTPTAASHRAAVEVAEVAAALDRGEIVPWYMPIVDLHTGAVVAVEALARWLHPVRGVLAADAFIPLVEQSELIIDFDLMMLTRALADLQQWRGARGDADNVAVAVNFSAHHFYRSDCAEKIDAVTSAAGVHPSSVILEITETVAVSTTALMDAHVIDDLRARGYLIVFDDIGGSWLPAEHLLSIGVNGLKADRTVGSALHTPTGRAIARALTALTTELGQFLVIEGIETPEHAHQARMIGARLGQGYLWSPARPANTFPMLDP